jgi:predicted nucleic acid-binding protein
MRITARGEYAIRAVLDLALATGLTTYDATYLFLARSLGLPLATLDQRLRCHAQGP